MSKLDIGEQVKIIKGVHEGRTGVIYKIKTRYIEVCFDDDKSYWILPLNFLEKIENSNVKIRWYSKGRFSDWKE